MVSHNLATREFTWLIYCLFYIYSYINDLPAAEHLQHSLTLMFADDTKYIIIKHICNVTDCAHALLQDDIRTSCCTIKLLL